MAQEILRLRFDKILNILPNPIYGDWEKAVFEYKKDLSTKEKYDLREFKLTAY